jgi:hypothetical protein
MRVHVAALAGSVALASWSPAAATCAQAREVAAFNVRALQSQLMVGALTCDLHDQYNTFVLRHRGELDSSRRALITYFSRAGGGERAFNSYDTELANTQSTLSTRRGNLFCSEIRPVFSEVLGLPNATEVQKYAVAKGLPQPRTVQPCGAPATAASSQRR